MNKLKKSTDPGFKIIEMSADCKEKQGQKGNLILSRIYKCHKIRFIKNQFTPIFLVCNSLAVEKLLFNNKIDNSHQNNN